MGLSRLILLSLIASVAVSTFAAQSDPAPPVCDLSTVIPKLARHCQSNPDVPSILLSPTVQCCEALASLPGQEEMALPCLCRAAGDPRLVAARLDVPRIFALYRRCVKGSFRRGPSFANQYCEEEDIETEKCNAANLATRVSRYCVINGKITSACCLAPTSTTAPASWTVP